MPTYRLFGSTNGPATPASYSGAFVAGIGFEVTSGGCWLEGYWWWVCPEGQTTADQKFALWQPYEPPGVTHGVVVAGTAVTSGVLTPGQWNYVPLGFPVPLSIGQTYIAATGFHGDFPITKNSFAKGDPFADGIASGPLVAFSDQSGTRPQPFGLGQALYSVSGTDPTTNMPATSDDVSSNFWIDLQVTTEAPTGTSYRLWPSMPVASGLGGEVTDPPDVGEQSMGTEFWLSGQYARYTLDKIWFWSPVPSAYNPGDPPTALLPGSCAIFAVTPGSTPQGTMVQGTQQGDTGPSPSVTADWRKPDGTAAQPGDGWVYCAYEGVTLPPGKYKTAVYCYSGGVNPTGNLDNYLFFGELPDYFGTNPGTGAPGPAAANGIVNGPLTSPNVPNAALANGNGSISTDPPVLPGNSTYHNNDSTDSGTFVYPDTFDDKDNGETRWVDVEVTPVPQANPPGEGTMLSFFP